MTDLASIVDKVGSPAYVYDLAEVRANRLRLRAALPPRSGLFHALGTNAHPELLREIRAGGALPEVCTPSELDTALTTGWPAADVLYTGRSGRDIDWALQKGVRRFVADSPAGVKKLDHRAAAHGVSVSFLLRINGGGPTAVGVPSAWVNADPARFTGGANAQLSGLYAQASELSDVDGWVLAVGELAWTIATYGGCVDVLHFGGSTPVPGLRERLTAAIDREVPAGAAPPRLEFEAGRYLVGSAGTLITAVMDTKPFRDKEIVVLEFGVDAPDSFAAATPLTPRGDLVDSVLVGPFAESWAHEVRLSSLRPGDLLVVPGVGAHGPTTVPPTHPLPVEVVIDRDDPDSSAVHVSRLLLTRYPDNQPDR
ncbi:type III PLP-dependent enzyme [Actinophytocola sp.]|uniref:type III PLP-dependent enzyme n=1 Tax=Actinophytocola sp. TaxID=1872138 RepID=UPI002ED5481E